MSLCPGRAWSPHHAPPSERAGHVAESRAQRVRRGLFFTAVTVTQTVRAGAGPPWVSSGMPAHQGPVPDDTVCLRVTTVCRRGGRNGFSLTHSICYVSGFRGQRLGVSGRQGSAQIPRPGAGPGQLDGPGTVPNLCASAS